MDLLLHPSVKADPPKLEIKKDAKGMVTVQGATVVEVRELKGMVTAQGRGEGAASIYADTHLVSSTTNLLWQHLPPLQHAHDLLVS